MQDFVIHISNYAHELNSDFIIIPQNGIELAFNDQDPANGLNLAYLNAIDGVGVEELFYNGDTMLLPPMDTWEISNYIKKELADIRYGNIEDTHKWMYKVC